VRASESDSSSNSTSTTRPWSPFSTGSSRASA
jgi:hypothetical protein